MAENKGLYGEAQGNESRAAGRHNGAVIDAEHLLDNTLIEGEILNGTQKGDHRPGTTPKPGWIALWKLGAWDSLNREIEQLRREWGDAFLMPETKRGESAEDYIKRVRKERDAWRARVERKIQSLLAQATRGQVKG